jgi:hypothetical protein
MAAPSATTRTVLRSSLQRKTDGQLTTAADQDLYLDLADLYIARRWMTFDPGRFRDARASDTTNSTTGILTLGIDTTRIERVEDANKVKYPLIDIEDRWNKTGYYPTTYDVTNKKTQIQIMKNGAVHANATMYWFDLGLVQMGDQAGDAPSIPEEFRDTIATVATWFYFRDQGPPFLETSRGWKSEALDDLSEAKQVYRTFAHDPKFMASNSPDAGGSFRIGHVVS